MYIQPVFDEDKAVTYMCHYFSKTEDRCSQAIKQTAKKVTENNIHHHDTMKTIAKGRMFCARCSVLVEIPPEERVQILLSDKVPDSTSK